MSNLPAVITREWNGQPVRAILLDGIWWIFAQDISDLLGLKRARRFVSRLEYGEKRLLTKAEAEQLGGAASIEGAQPPQEDSRWLVTQEGAQKILITSHRPGAAKLLNWIVYELIPAAQEGRVAHMPGDIPDQMVAVHADHMRSAEVALANLEAQLAVYRAHMTVLHKHSEELVQLQIARREHATRLDEHGKHLDEHTSHLAVLDGEVVEIKDDLWARTSAIPRKTCRGWAAKAKRDGRLLVEPNDSNLRRLGARTGKLVRAAGLQKDWVDDDRHDEVGHWPVEQIEAAAVELGFVKTSP